MIKIRFLSWFFFYLMFAYVACQLNGPQTEFRSSLPTHIRRTWIGAEYWANPLQDWQLRDGRIECITSGGDRNVFLLTHELSDKAGSFQMSVRLGKLNHSESASDDGWVGFKIGVRGEFNDYRSDAVRGFGYPVGVTTRGELFIGNLSKADEKIELTDGLRLELKAISVSGKYQLTLTAYDKNGKLLNQISRDDVDADWLHGGVALVCSWGKLNTIPEVRPTIDDGNWGFRPGTKRGGEVRFWFADWQLSGSKVTRHPDRVFGPTLFTQYALSDGILKMTAQMAPMGEKDPPSIRLEIRKNESGWQGAGEAYIDPMARTATFRVENWDGSADVPYRLIYGPFFAHEKKSRQIFEGIIRKEPWDKDEIVVAAFTGNNDLGFPNSDIFNQVKKHEPDLLFFSGDQIYEGVGGFGVQRSPLDKATLDYLRKWYLYGWAYGELMRDRPTIAIPDDHDVYHGNIWGAGGKAAPTGLRGYKAQDAGGYKMPAQWVNMVQRTQTSHLPDPYDPTPVKQGIGVYYCSLNYAGISFAILEDRKFKSPPKALLPEADIQNGWARNRKFNAKTQADAPGAILLGERQLTFLRDWAADWRNKTWMKVALSQTIFANVATLPREEAYSDEIVPRLRILKSNEYPPDDIPVSDMDSNGWPQTGRNKALRELRRAFALHIAGDQHLGSTIQYGIENWGDAGYAFCVPAISNVWPRRWYPVVGGKHRNSGAPKYTGDFEDGFGNKITVSAVANPIYSGMKPSRLYDRSTGFGIVRFNRNTRHITIECWRRAKIANDPNGGQYPGWPITIHQYDNCAQSATFYLPTVKVKGLTDPVVQVIDEQNGEIVYTIRINGMSFRPKVFQKGSYMLRVWEPDTKQEKIVGNISAMSAEDNREITINF